VRAYRLYPQDDNYNLKDLFFDDFDLDNTLWAVDSGYSDFEVFSEKLRSEIDADEQIKTAVLNRMNLLMRGIKPEEFALLQARSIVLLEKFKAAAISQDIYLDKFTDKIYYSICSNKSAKYVASGMLRSGILNTIKLDIPRLVLALRNDKRKHNEWSCSGDRALPEGLISAIEALSKQK
jgi:hypothetical protein